MCSSDLFLYIYGEGGFSRKKKEAGLDNQPVFFSSFRSTNPLKCKLKKRRRADPPPATHIISRLSRASLKHNPLLLRAPPRAVPFYQATNLAFAAFSPRLPVEPLHGPARLNSQPTLPEASPTERSRGRTEPQCAIFCSAFQLNPPSLPHKHFVRHKPAGCVTGEELATQAECVCCQSYLSSCVRPEWAMGAAGFPASIYAQVPIPIRHSSASHAESCHQSGAPLPPPPHRPPNH